MTDAFDTGYAADLAAMEERSIALSAATYDAIHATVVDPTAIRACGRVLGISRTLASKILRLSTATDLAVVLTVMPGKRGWQTVLDALRRTKCDARLIGRLQEEIARFDSTAEKRGIDREALVAMAGGGLDSKASRQEHRRLREQAFHAMSMTWGVLAEVRLASFLVLPSGSNDFLDIESVSSLRGLHRIGPGPNPRIQMSTGAFLASKERRQDPAGPRNAAGDWYDSRHSTRGIESELQVHDDPAGRHVHFEGANTSKTRKVDVVFREHLEKAGYQHARVPRELGNFGAGILLPSRWFVLEVLVDREIPWNDPPEASSFSQLPGMAHRYRWPEMQRLPMTESAQCGIDADLPDELDSFRVPHHAVLADAADRLGRTLADFNTHIVAVPWPILSSNIQIQWRLPSTDPGSGA